MFVNKYPVPEEASEEEIKDLVFAKLVLSDYYASCVKPSISIDLNERTPFVEHIVPLFKYFSAAYKTISFQWCEKGLDTNKYISLYHVDKSGSRRLADGFGYGLGMEHEVLLMESSGERNAKENTLKLLECSIRALNAEMEKVQFASVKTFKERSFLTCLYAKDKLTLMSTFLVDYSNRWGFVFVRETVVPRSWAGHRMWLRVFELMFYLKEHLEVQTRVSEQLVKEAGGFFSNLEGDLIKDMKKQ